ALADKLGALTPEAVLSKAEKSAPAKLDTRHRWAFWRGWKLGPGVKSRTGLPKSARGLAVKRGASEKGEDAQSGQSSPEPQRLHDEPTSNREKPCFLSLFHPICTEAAVRHTACTRGVAAGPIIDHFALVVGLAALAAGNRLAPVARALKTSRRPNSIVGKSPIKAVHTVDGNT
ncbi:unnamed protein product, partial [Polarella glacialis]